MRCPKCGFEHSDEYSCPMCEQHRFATPLKPVARQPETIQSVLKVLQVVVIVGSVVAIAWYALR